VIIGPAQHSLLASNSLADAQQQKHLLQAGLGREKVTLGLHQQFILTTSGCIGTWRIRKPAKRRRNHATNQRVVFALRRQSWRLLTPRQRWRPVEFAAGRPQQEVTKGQTQRLLDVLGEGPVDIEQQVTVALDAWCI